MIYVVVDDIAFVTADAVVRPATTSLEPTTAALRHLEQVGGPSFLKQIQVNQDLAVGAAVVTGGGDLPAPFVIHAIIVTLVSFLNLGLAGFVLSSIVARFIFPAVSLEGRQMWLLRSSPLDLKALLWSKYWVGTVPLLILALIIIMFTNVLLRASPFMMIVSVGTITMLTMAISAMALAFGALYPQFETENAAQIPTSFGGLIYMMSTIALLAVVIVIEAQPVSVYLAAEFQADAVSITPTMILAFIAVIVVCATATVVPLRMGLKRMEQFEF